MKQGAYIFNDETEFIKVLEEIANHYTEESKFNYLDKYLTSVKGVKNEIKFLNNCKLNSFQGFRKDSVIKVSLTDKFNCDVVITYFFNNSYNRSAYGLLFRYLRKREQHLI